MRPRTHNYDKILLYITFILVFIGIVVLSSVSVAISQENFGEPYYYLKHQLLRGVLLGIIFFYIGLKVNYKFWQKISLPLLIFNTILLVMALSDFFSAGYNEARRWIELGSISFQPSELLKISFVFYLASLLEKKKKMVSDFHKGFLPFMITLTGISALLIAQPDISTLGIIILTSIAVYFMAGANIKHLALTGVTGVMALFVLIRVASYRVDRWLVFLHPSTDPQGIGYQINQALIAIGSGGIYGLGLGHSKQKLLYLPEAIGDSIFAITAEELGLIGASILILLFIVLVIRGFSVAKRAPNQFAKLTAFGIIFWIVMQAFVNMAAISGLLPLTGIPLPFISYGGTSLALTLFGMGVVLNISKHTS